MPTTAGTGSLLDKARGDGRTGLHILLHDAAHDALRPRRKGAGSAVLHLLVVAAHGAYVWSQPGRVNALSFQGNKWFDPRWHKVPLKGPE